MKLLRIPGPAQDAWQQMLAFLKDQLSGTAGKVPSHSETVGRIYYQLSAFSAKIIKVLKVLAKFLGQVAAHLGLIITAAPKGL
jgi:hypothetical protein